MHIFLFCRYVFIRRNRFANTANWTKEAIVFLHWSFAHLWLCQSADALRERDLVDTLHWREGNSQRTSHAERERALVQQFLFLITHLQYLLVLDML